MARAQVLRAAHRNLKNMNTNMPWILLILAGLLEVVWAIGLKQTDGFTRLWPSIWTLVTAGCSLALLGLAMKSLPVGTAYTVWMGIGAVGTVTVGILWLGEPANTARLFSIALIIVGLISLKLTTAS